MHTTLRGIYQEMLSPKTVVETTPFVESCLARRAETWDQIAKKGKVRQFSQTSAAAAFLWTVKIETRFYRRLWGYCIHKHRATYEQTVCTLMWKTSVCHPLFNTQVYGSYAVSSCRHHCFSLLYEMDAISMRLS